MDSHTFETSAAARVALPRRHLIARFVVPLCLLLGAAAVFLISGWSSLRPATSVAVFPVVGFADIDDPGETKARAGEVLFQAAGWVEPDQFAINASVLIPGVVKSIDVLEGSVVKKGQVLATLIPDDARLAVMQAKAQLDLKIAEKQQALAVVEQLHAERLVHEDQLTRLEEAYAEGAATERNVIQQRLRLDAHQKQCDAASVMAGSISDAEIEIARAKLAVAELALDRTTIKSPMNGVVLERLAEPGMPRSPSMEHSRMGYIVRLYDPNSLQVRVDVPLNEAARVGVGQPAEIVVDVLPGEVFRGEVTRLVHEADIQKNTIEVKVRISDPDVALRPEMLSRVRFLRPQEKEEAKTDPPTATRRQIKVPVSLVTNDGPESGTLMVVDARTMMASKRIVALGPRNGTWIVVEQGLQPGDRVIVPTDHPVEEGRAVTIASEWTGEPGA